MQGVREDDFEGVYWAPWADFNRCEKPLIVSRRPRENLSIIQDPEHLDSMVDSHAMKTLAVRLLFAVLSMVAFAAAQDSIPLYPGTLSGPTQDNYPEKQYFSKVWNEDVVANVTRPTLTMFKPSPASKNGTAVIIYPGGGFMALSIATEGTSVAKYLDLW